MTTPPNSGGSDNSPGDKPDRTKDIHGPQDPLVDRFRPDPAHAPVRGITLKGFLGDSDREGHRRLYLTKNLDYYVEFATDDVIDSAGIPPDRPPFVGAEATEVTLKEGAHVSYTHSAPVRPSDDFDLDVRRVSRTGPRGPQRGRGLTPRGSPAALARRAAGRFAPQEGCTCGAPCGQQTIEFVSCASCEDTCVSCEGTCDQTCPQSCNGTCDDTCQFTCAPTCAATCETCFTCNTCGDTGCTVCCEILTGVACG
ncbi:hypothetical protein [Kitasatospora sp. NPDC088346]|uniref:hypothetical protein n=1 Tax=Kitasatospora sp. NPDC088346 TaxID=3364073 RepID=UPI003822794B